MSAPLICKLLHIWGRRIEEMTTEHGIVPLAEGDIEKAGAVLARAFLGNPFIAYAFPEEEERKRLSAIQFSAFIRYGFLAGRALTTNGGPE